MERSFKVVFFLCDFLFLLTVCSSKIVVIRDLPDIIDSDELDYPPINKSIDVFWKADHSIRLQIEHFHLDGQHGDFLLISELPLIYDNDIEGQEMSAEIFSKVYISSQGLLLSWSMPNKTIDILSQHGTYIYFHAEKRELPNATLDQFITNTLGFQATLQNLDDLRAPPPPVTPEPIIPGPSDDLYYTIYIENPSKNFSEPVVDRLKFCILKMTKQYALDNNLIDEDADITLRNISLPYDGGIRYCDPFWVNHEACTQIYFAFDARDEEDRYVMDQVHLEEMWENEKYVAIFEETGEFYKFDDADSSGFQEAVWISVSLGLVTFFLVVACVAWLKGVQTTMKRRRLEQYASGTKGAMGDFSKVSEINDEDGNSILDMITTSMRHTDKLKSSSVYKNPAFVGDNDDEEVDESVLDENTYSFDTTSKRSPAKGTNSVQPASETSVEENFHYDFVHPEYQESTQ